MATLYNYKVESKKMGFTTRFQYEIDHVLFDRNIPLIEGAPQEAYIYKNGELIYSDVEKKKRLENGYGLRKMKDYVQTHAGTFKVDGEDGFQVQVELPLVAVTEEKGEK